MADTYLLGTPTGAFGAKTDTRYTRMYNNQFFDYMSEQLPKNHAEMMKWCEVVYANTPVVTNAIKKLINYPLTSFIYKSDATKIKEDTKKFLEDDLDMMSHLIDVGLDYYIYGNTFRSVYFPFTRFLKCSSCSTEVNIQQAQYRMRKGKFILKCGECNTERIATTIDRDREDASKISLIRWDPKQIELFANPITAEVNHYYTLPAEVRQGIVKGDRTIISSLPQIFLDAFATSKAIQFTSNFYHLKTGSLAGYSSAWGISPLVPCLKLYMYTGILRKSVEAIGLEHITPQRILFPQGATNDPTIMSSMSQWKEQVQKAIQRWRTDPNYVMLAPFPTGVTNLGSQGRQLMPNAELRAAEEDMIRALDIPVEFVYGTSNLNNSGVALRILENQLRPYVSQITKYVNWVIDTVNTKYKKDYCHIELAPFTLSDDLMNKQLLMQAVGNGVSKTTMLEALDLDPQEEATKATNEIIDDMKQQKILQKTQQDLEQDISNKVYEDQAAEMNGSIPQYDQQQLIAVAQQQAQQLMSVPYEERKSLLAQLQNEDYVMWALVTKQLDYFHQQAKKQPQESSSQNEQMV